MINANKLKIIKIFLKRNCIENCRIKEIQGDASFRKYFRIYHKNDSYILAFGGVWIFAACRFLVGSRDGVSWLVGSILYSLAL